jgi:hypothetical protein
MSVRTCKGVCKDRKQIYLNCVNFKAKLFTLAMDWGNDVTDTGQLTVFIRGTGNAFQAHEELDSCHHVTETKLIFFKLRRFPQEDRLNRNFIKPVYCGTNRVPVQMQMETP